MWFSFPCAIGSLVSAPGPWKKPLRKDLQYPLFPWEKIFNIRFSQSLGSWVHRRQEKRILKIFSQGFFPWSWGRDQRPNCTGHIAGDFFTSWAIRETQEYCPLSSISSWPKNRTEVSCIVSGFFTNWAIREALMTYRTILIVNALDLAIGSRKFQSKKCSERITIMSFDLFIVKIC